MNETAERTEQISDDVEIHYMPSGEFHIYARNPHDVWRWGLWTKLLYQGMARDTACKRAAELKAIRRYEINL